MKTEDWLEQIRGSRELLDLHTDKYPDALVLALIDVESDGDPSAHREGSQFFGLLQMGKSAGLDVDIADVSELDGEDGDPYAEDDVIAFFELCERYADRHGYHPYGIATLWKGGAGTAHTVYERIARGVEWGHALAYAERVHKIPGLREYVRRFRAAMIRWNHWLNANGGICV